jgi:hypothetical protein
MERDCGVPVGGRELRIPEASLLVSAVGWPLAVRVPRGSVVLQCYCMPGATSSTCDPAHLQDDSVRALRKWLRVGAPSPSPRPLLTSLVAIRRLPTLHQLRPAEDRRSSGSTTCNVNDHKFILLSPLFGAHSAGTTACPLSQGSLNPAAFSLTHWLAGSSFVPDNCSASRLACTRSLLESSR